MNRELNIENGQQTKHFITFLKVLACLLITNSHCKNIYPISFLAVGGGFGNALFFIISGYCLANIRLPFGKWYGRRIKRILPSLVVIIAIDVFFVKGIDAFGENCWYENVRLYLNQYWFCFAIILYYIIFWLLFFSGNKKIVWCGMAAHLIGYFFLYFVFVDRTVFSVELGGFSPFKVYYYFFLMMAGGMLRLDQGKLMEIFGKRERSVIRLLIGLLLFSLFLWTAEYAAIMLREKGLAVQFLIHVGVLGIAISLMLLFAFYENFFEELSLRRFNLLRILSESTLDIYLVQITFRHFAEMFSFPVSWLVFWLVAIGGGFIYHMGISKIVRN